MAVIEQEEVSDLAVYKSNDLIQASYKLSLIEQRILLCCIGKVDSRKPAHMQENRFRLSVAEYLERFPDANRNNAYRDLRDAAVDLFRREVKITKGKKTSLIHWCSEATYHDGEGWVELAFTPQIAPYLTALGPKFTKYEIAQIAHLRSAYSLRLFEMLMQFKSTGALNVELEKFVNWLQLPYERYADIKRRVIDVAVQEINAKSNMRVEWKAIKQGRSVARLLFTFKEEPQGKLPLES